MSNVDLRITVTDDSYAVAGEGMELAARVVWHAVAELQQMGFRGTFTIKGRRKDDQATEIGIATSGQGKAKGTGGSTGKIDSEKGDGFRALDKILRHVHGLDGDADTPTNGTRATGKPKD